jgi:putative ABC transport system substrate-binding protein
VARGWGNIARKVQAAGGTLGIEIQSLEVRDPDDFDGAFETVRRQHPDALMTVEDPLTFNYRKRIADFAVGQLLPTLHGFREDVAAGYRRQRADRTAAAENALVER